MTYDTDQPARRKLIGLIFLCLAVRVVMPVGYMPASIGEGGPFVLCPGGLSGASLILDAQAHNGGRHAGHDNGHDHASDDGSHFWEFCPFGAAFGTAIVASDVAIVLPEFAQNPAAMRVQLPARRTASHPFHARAPPLTSRSA